MTSLVTARYIFLLPLILVITLCGCKGDGRYEQFKVISRTNVNDVNPDLVMRVPVVFEHDGDNSCLNITMHEWVAPRTS